MVGSPSPGCFTRAQARPPVVLVLDDESTVVHVLGSLLEEQGCSVHRAGSAEAALELLEETDFDVAIVDIVLPGKNGLQFLAEVKALSPSTEVLLMTSHASVETAIEAIQRGAYDYLRKPFENIDDVWICVSRAIEKRHLSERAAAAAEAEARALALESSSRAKSLLLGRVSHELRTPLNGIVCSTSLLQQTRLDARQARYAEIIRSSSEDLLGLIRDLLDMTHLESGQLTVAMEPFDLRQCVREALDSARLTACGKDIPVSLDLDTRVPPSVAGDARRVRQVLSNLLGNAVKFTEKGAVQVRILALGADPEFVRIRFEVQDTGIGVSPDQQARIFEAFTQVDESMTRKHQGVGLGLSIAKDLVERMGGSIGVESRPGAGSLFWFMVPFQSCSRLVEDADPSWAGSLRHSS